MSSHSDTGKFFRGVRGDVSENYRLLNHLGSGANGEVWAAMLTTPRTADEIAEDVKPMCEQKVAIKKIHNCFGQATEAKRILRELRILRHLRHNNIISIRDVLAPTSESSFSDLWVVFDFVDLDLRKLIASNQTITTAHVQWICHQMLSALLYLHSAHVLHRDLKPANVLLSGACDVKICDFGLSRVVNEEDWKAQERRLTNVGLQRSSSSASNLGSCPKVSRQMTSHVVTRWYRAPELILLQPYTTAIDVWSFACIFAELLLMLPEATRSPADRNALFPGQSCFPLSPDNDDLNSPPSLDQLNVIFQVLGTPSGPFGWVERAEMREYLATLEPRAGQRLEELVPGSPAEAIDLLRSMLQFRPSMRCSVAEAMDHPFFEGMAARAPATLARWPVDVATIDFEGTDIRIPQLRKKILGEIRLHSERGSPRVDGGRQVQLGESDGSHRTSTDGASTGGASTDGAGTGSASTGGAGTGGASNDNACVGVAEGDSASSSSSTAADGDRSLVPATNDPAQEKRPFEEEVLRNVRSRRCSREHPKAESQPESGASLTHHVTPSSHDTDGDTNSSNPSLKP